MSLKNNFSAQPSVGPPVPGPDQAPEPQVEQSKLVSPQVVQKVARLISQDEMFVNATPQQISDRMRMIESMAKIIRNNLSIQDDVSRKIFFTQVLTIDSPAIRIDDPFVITHICRDDETYDTISVSSNSYNDQKIQIKINGVNLFSETIPVALLPKTGQYAYPLAAPYYLSKNTQVELTGGIGLSNLKISLIGYYQCFSVVNPAIPHIMVIESKMQASSPELNPTADIPSWMLFAHKYIHSAQMWKNGTDYEYSAYGNASSNHLQGKVRFPYPHGNILNMQADRPARMYAGSREFPLEMTEEFLTPGNSIQWEKTTTSFSSNEWYDYLVIGGYYFGIL